MVLHGTARYKNTLLPDTETPNRYTDTKTDTKTPKIKTDTKTPKIKMSQ